MSEGADFNCPFDCPFLELEHRINRDVFAPRVYTDKSVSELKEACDEKKQQIEHEWGIDVPCGIAGELLVNKVLQGRI